MLTTNEITLIMIMFVLSFLINYFFTKVLIRYSSNLKLIDFPSERKMHSLSMPVVGGLSICITVFIFFIYFYFTGYFYDLFDNFEIVAFAISSIIIVITGLVDDRYGLGPFNKFLFQLISALVFLIGLDINHTIIFNFLDNNILHFLVNVFFIVGIINAFNLIDGLDGLAGGVSLIVSLTFIALNLLSGSSNIEIYSFVIIIGCLFSFLIFNKSPAETFLGDTGSLFLGWYFAVNSIYFAERTALSLSILMPFMILGLPAFDVLFVMIKRFVKRHNYKVPFIARLKAIFMPDNNHLHHLIIRGGISKRMAIIVLYIITIISSLVGIFFWINQDRVSLIYGIIFILMLIFFIRLYFEIKIKSLNK